MRFSFTSRSVRHSSAACAALALLLAGSTRAAIVDRVEIAIGHHAITASQIDEEVRLMDLLNHAPLQIDAASRRKAAQQLIEQYFVARETEISHFPEPEPADETVYLQKVEELYGSPAGLQKALEQYGVTKPVLEEHLLLQLRTIAFSRFRFPTDEALSTWLGESRRRASIVFLDKALE